SLRILNDFKWNEACCRGNTEAITDHELIRELLIQPAINLMAALDQRPKDTRENKELLLMVFEEAANLWVGSDKKNGAPYFALRRVLGMLKSTPIWSFLLSTQSSIQSIMPSWELESSSRVKAGRLNILELFLAFQL